MKLYPKKLNSIEALQAEKRRLKAQAHIALGDVVSPEKKSNSSANTHQKSEKDTPFDLVQDLLSGFLYNNSPARLADTAVKVAIPILKYVGVKVEQKAVKSIAKDVILSYAKWKAIELGYKSVYSYFRAKWKK